MDPSMITPEMMAFAQKQMANMSPEQIVRAFPCPSPSTRCIRARPHTSDLTLRSGFLLLFSFSLLCPCRRATCERSVRAGNTAGDAPGPLSVAALSNPVSWSPPKRRVHAFFSHRPRVRSYDTRPVAQSSARLVVAPRNLFRAPFFFLTRPPPSSLPPPTPFPLKFSNTPPPPPASHVYVSR